MIANGAESYLNAARALQSDQLTGPHPFWFCVFQSIELSLKSFLRGKGRSKEELKARVLGHRLAALYDLAKDDGLAEFVTLTDEEATLVCVVGEMYSRKVFQYTEVGWLHLPYAYHALALAEKLYSAIRPFAEAQRAFHHDKPTAVKEEANQPLQRNASTGSVLNFESPARRG